MPAPAINHTAQANRKRRHVGEGHRASFDHLVGAHLQRLRDGHADRFCGLQVDHQLELGRGLHRQIGGFSRLSRCHCPTCPMGQLAGHPAGRPPRRTTGIASFCAFGAAVSPVSLGQSRPGGTSI